MWHSHFVRWIKLRSFLEKSGLPPAEVQVGMYVRPPWECCVPDESAGIARCRASFLSIPPCPS